MAYKYVYHSLPVSRLFYPTRVPAFCVNRDRRSYMTQVCCKSRTRLSSTSDPKGWRRSIRWRMKIQLLDDDWPLRCLWCLFYRARLLRWNANQCLRQRHATIFSSLHLTICLFHRSLWLRQFDYKSSINHSLRKSNYKSPFQPKSTYSKPC